MPLASVAEISLSRYSNSPPATPFFWTMGSTLKGPLRVAAALLALTKLGSQFTSTLLVADLSPGGLEAFDKNISAPYRRKYLHNEASDFRVGFKWDQKLSGLATFAEYSEGSQPQEGIDDTGPTIRASLPIPQQDSREKLRYFSGTARVYDARVACVRPELKDLRFDSEKPGQFCGMLNLPKWPEVVRAADRDQGRNLKEWPQKKRHTI